MINFIEGKIAEVTDASITVNVGGLYYEIFVLKSVFKTVEEKGLDQAIKLVIYHYHQVDHSKSVPTLIGFNNKLEREFFEKFITVAGIGPKAALRALSVPISRVAEAIDKSDIQFLKTLPGVGERRAREIIAKLQGRVSRFGLIQDNSDNFTRIESHIQDEAMDVLMQLQYKRDEAKRMIDRAVQNNAEIKNTEELLNEVYRRCAKEGVLIGG